MTWLAVVILMTLKRMIASRVVMIDCFLCLVHFMPSLRLICSTLCLLLPDWSSLFYVFTICTTSYGIAYLFRLALVWRLIELDQGFLSYITRDSGIDKLGPESPNRLGLFSEPSRLLTFGKIEVAELGLNGPVSGHCRTQTEIITATARPSFVHQLYTDIN